MHSPQQRGSELRAVFADISEKCTLPPLPQIAARALHLVQDPDTGYADVATVIEKDPALAARVLRMASSAFYVRRVPPDCLRDAIRTLGMGGLRDIIVAAALRPSFDPDDDFHKELWQHLLATGVAAEAIAREMGARRGGPAFICGLLHDTGRLVHHLTAPAAFAELEMADRDAPCPEEGSHFGATHDSVAACLAWKWELDPQISEALMGHHGDPAEAAPLTRQVILGDCVSRVIEGDDEQRAALPALLLSAGLSCDPDRLTDEVRQSVEENRSFFQ